MQGYERSTRGYFVEEDGVVYAVTFDNRFVTSGETRDEALSLMKDVLAAHYSAAQRYGFRPFQKLSEEPHATPSAQTWELQPA